jgi:hypothetical protein
MDLIVQKRKKRIEEEKIKRGNQEKKWNKYKKRKSRKEGEMIGDSLKNKKRLNR